MAIVKLYSMNLVGYKNFIKSKGGLPDCARCQAEARAIAPAAARVYQILFGFSPTRTASRMLSY